ncbi:TRAP transporter substrate-binding protein [Azospirillum sp. RWY-5-1]|uniref:TRAP transporter substrate-binding protein n=1 Tax=Azospirillum oleiclasticum TaxID=2735135 RepID=A0ABX2T5T0_9PROT|nr:TRAP transporter substrate-binding protein [Azospirillum oleiclasticum]NYZ19603.1 TRAP transporter substrate-binding protein [Azospirillum oleiclasticum]
MKRRAFLAGAAGGVAGSAIAAPAIAQERPAVSWRLASSFPKSTDILFGTSELIARRVAEITEDKFQIRVHASGEIVPGLQVMDAVQKGTVECGHTCGYYYVGKDPTLAFDTAIPFGPNARQQNAWFQYGGGREVMRELFKQYNIVQFQAGNTGAQMGGWFRKEIRSLQDLSGLKMRIAGIAGQVMAKLGVTPTQIAGSDVYPALEKGTIDATEFVGPYDDEKLGFVQVAKNYYYPGWWEGGPQVSLYVNMDAHEALPKPYKAALEAACAEANGAMLARYDAENAKALKRLIGRGAVLRPFPRDVLEAGHKAAMELYDELSASNPRFKTVYESWRPFLDDTRLWFRVAELPFDGFVSSVGAQKR